MEDSMEKEVLLCSLTFLAIWWCYGFKWAILILFTLWLVQFAVKNYHNGDILARKGFRSYQDHRTRSGKNILEESHDMSDLGSTGRTIRTIRRRYANPVSLKRDLTFTDLQMNRNLSPRRGSSLKSPEPLISQVTRHLSFSNVSYYPDRTRNQVLPQVHHHNTTLNTTRPKANSYLLSPIKSPNTSLNDISPQQKPFLDVRSSPLQARYSPRCFSILDPTLNMTESPSTVKITQPCEAIEGSPLSFESILQKRLQRTKENPCSRQAVLSALVEKSRKRAVSETDGSFLEPTYSVKKRRRDDLDDFLDSIADSSPSLAKVSSGIVKSLKRQHLHSDGDLFTSLRADKRLRERHSSSEEQILGSIDKGKLGNSDEDENAENTLNNISTVACGNAEDSGVVLSSCDETNSEPGKTKKGKSVTFSRELESQSSNKITRSHEVHGDLNEKPCPTENGETIHARKSAEFLIGFQARFSPRKSLHLNTTSPIAKAKEKKGHRRSHLTWKDLQENRREASRRSQKLLDDIEESIAREKGEPSGSLVSQTTSSNPSLADGTSKTTETSINNNVKNGAMPASNLFGSTTSQGLPVTSLPTTSFPSTINSETGISTTNASLQTSQPLQQINAAGKLTLQTTTTTVLSSQSLQQPSLVPNSSASSAPNSGFMFANNQSGVNFGVNTAVSTATTSGPFNFAGGITGTSGDISSKVGTSEFMFAVPKSPVKKATIPTTTISMKPSFGNSFTSAASPFSGFGTSSTGTTSVVQPSTKTTTLSLTTTSSNFAPTATPQTTSTQFGFLGNVPSSTTYVAQTNPSTFSFKALPAGTSSTALPQATSSTSTFSFKAQPGVPTFGNTAQSTVLSSSQSRPTGLFSFAAASGTAGVFGVAGTQTSNAPGFSYPAQNGPGFGSFGSQGSGVAVATAAGQAKPGGFSFTAPAVNKPSPMMGGYNFGQNQTTSGTFNFGSPAPAAGGFNFGGAGVGPGTPFASSTPMSRIAGGVTSGGTFALGSLASSTTPGSRQRQRRRKNKN